MRKIILITILFIAAFGLGRASTFAAPDTAQPPLPPQITVCPKDYLAGEETLYLEGRAEDNSSITIYLKQGEKIKKEWRTASNDKSEWFFNTNELIKSGNYSLAAKAEKENLVSDFSQKCEIAISLKGISLGLFLVSFKTLSFVLGGLLLLLLVLFLYIILRSKALKKLIRKEAREAREMLYSTFENLDKQIEKRIELFDSQAGFNIAERQVYNDLKKYLDTAKNSIEKEIKDIEEYLK